MTAQETIQLFRETALKWQQSLDSFPSEFFDWQPEPDKWSAAQVILHMYKADRILPYLLQQAGQDPGRDASARIDEMRAKMEDVEKPLQATPQVLPGSDPIDREILLSKYRKLDAEVESFLDGADLDLIHPEVPHPRFGVLSRREWIAFSAFHRRRHMAQLQALFQAVSRR